MQNVSRTAVAPYEFRDADGLIGDYFAAVEQACRQEGVAFEFDAEEIELEDETENDEDLGE
jgi:hypothetical protein